jgi:chromosome segregation ATPase
LKLQHEQEKLNQTSDANTQVTELIAAKEKLESEKHQLTDQIQHLQQKLVELHHTNSDLSKSLDTISQNASHVFIETLTCLFCVE